MIAAETIASGAPDGCEECGTELTLEVCRSAAGFYLGILCACGPYSRESGYFRTAAEAEQTLENWKRAAAAALAEWPERN